MMGVSRRISRREASLENSQTHGANTGPPDDDRDERTTQLTLKILQEISENPPDVALAALMSAVLTSVRDVGGDLNMVCELGDTMKRQWDTLELLHRLPN
jgi:hypothetical protein